MITICIFGIKCHVIGPYKGIKCSRNISQGHIVLLVVTETEYKILEFSVSQVSTVVAVKNPETRNYKISNWDRGGHLITIHTALYNRKTCWTTILGHHVPYKNLPEYRLELAEWCNKGVVLPGHQVDKLTEIQYLK